MSRADAELVEGFLRKFNAEGIEPLLENIHPGFEGIVPASMSAEPDEYLGHEGVRRYMRLFDEVMEDLVFEPLEVTGLGGGLVLVNWRITGRGRGSGVEARMDAFILVTLREGLIARMEGHPTRESALAAAGVEA